MIKLTIRPTSPTNFTTVVTNDGEEINLRHYADGYNCSYVKESADMAKPYVTDALQSIIYKYGVQDMTVQGWNPVFEEEFCGHLATYTRYSNNTLPDLESERLKEQTEKLFNMSDKELCEAVNAHFGSHPTQPGQKDLKTQAAEALKISGEIKLPVYQRDTMVFQFARMQIQESRIKSPEFAYNPQYLDLQLMSQKNDTFVYKIDAALQKNDDGSVSVMGAYANGGEVNMGDLPDNFLRNNPMNVDRCSAEVQFTDFSNGKMKNVSVRVVMNSDEMSGDIINLDNDMLSGIEQNDGLQQ